ncbi:GDNF family receptor alpha-1 [Channa argus]|uniref:GDNF family receptor alpha-1 n=1 Tax=Channa argus TaxID=215402 RepID=A0A6G1R040_CHAAH|nr:GDNF family receptor alpha-1 [Channa argus]
MKEAHREQKVGVCEREEMKSKGVRGREGEVSKSRLADFFVNCQQEPRSLSGCLKENYADCLLSYSGLIGTVVTPNYLRSPKISVSPYCDCSNSGNNKDECDKFTEFFTENTCLRNAIQAFGNGTDVGVWQPMSPVQTTTSITTPYQRNRERNPNTIDNHINTDPGLQYFCSNLQDPQIVGPSTSNAMKNSAVSRRPAGLNSLLPLLLWLWCCSLPALPSPDDL